METSKSHLERRLLTERCRFKSEDAILEEVRQVMAAQESERIQIRETIAHGSSVNANSFQIDLLETDRIFHLSQIKTICIDYRLRFLDSRFFKDGIPEEAITQIRQLEKAHQTNLKGFRIMAPTKAFQLLSYDDPFLFAPIGNDYYYLVHKWGNDITPKRKWLMLPFKNLLNFVLFCLLISWLVTLVTPQTNLSKSVPMANIIIFLFAFKSIVAVFLYAFFMLGKNFNSAIWNRKYYNN